jgi:hypothetical protein
MARSVRGMEMLSKGVLMLIKRRRWRIVVGQHPTPSPHQSTISPSPSLDTRDPWKRGGMQPQPLYPLSYSAPFLATNTKNGT